MEVSPIRYAQNVTAVINTTPGAADDEAICNEIYGFLAPSLSVLLLTVCVFIRLNRTYKIRTSCLDAKLRLISVLCLHILEYSYSFKKNKIFDILALVEELCYFKRLFKLPYLMITYFFKSLLPSFPRL